MKLTKQKLKQMILESMYTPSTLITDAIAAPDVHPRIKDLLSSDSEDDKRNGLQLLSTLYPDKYGTGKIEDKLQMARQAYDQAVEADFGDSFTRASTDHVHLGSEKYKDTFKKSLPPNAVIENELEDFYSEVFRQRHFKVRRLKIKYDPRFGGQITVETQRLHGEDLRQLHAFIQHLIYHGIISGATAEKGRYNYSADIKIQYN